MLLHKIKKYKKLKQDTFYKNIFKYLYSCLTFLSKTTISNEKDKEE